MGNQDQQGGGGGFGSNRLMSNLAMISRNAGPAGPRSPGGAMMRGGLLGFQAIHENRTRGAMVGAAADRFRTIGTPEATNIAELLERSPEGALQFAEQFGGMQALEGMYRQRAAFQSAGRAMAKDETPADAMQNLIRTAPAGQVQPRLDAVKAYGDLQSQIESIKYPGQKYAAKLRREDFTDKSWARFARSGDFGHLVTRSDVHGGGGRMTNAQLRHDDQVTVAREQIENYKPELAHLSPAERKKKWHQIVTKANAMDWTTLDLTNPGTEDYIAAVWRRAGQKMYGESAGQFRQFMKGTVGLIGKQPDAVVSKSAQAEADAYQPGQ
jgi:hypothetical protein